MASPEVERILAYLTRVLASDLGSNVGRTSADQRSIRDWMAHGFGRGADWLRLHSQSVTAIEREEAANRIRATLTAPLSRPTVPAEQGGGPLAIPAPAQMLADLTGLTASVIRLRWDTLRQLAPGQDAFKTTEEFTQWFGRLNAVDKLMFVLQPGQPLLRDLWVARNLVRSDDRYRTFTRDSANRAVLDDYFLRGPAALERATPEQQQFVSWMQDQTRRLVAEGTAYEVFQGQGFWQQARQDLLTSLPYMIYNPAGFLERAFLREIVQPALGIVGRGIGTVARAVAPRTTESLGRMFMRRSLAYTDLLTGKLLKAMDDFGPQIRAAFPDQASFEKFMGQTRLRVGELRTQWQERFTSQHIADNNAFQQINTWKRQLGVDNKHFHVVQGVMNRQDNIWMEWVHHRASIENEIDDLLQQAAAASSEAVVRKAAVTATGSPITARAGSRYRAFTRPSEAIGDDVSLGSMFGFGGPYEIEVPRVRGTAIGPSQPGAIRGTFNPEDVTRVFVDPSEWLPAVRAKRLAADIPELKRLFPNAEIVEVRLADDATTRIAVRQIRAGPDVTIPAAKAALQEQVGKLRNQLLTDAGTYAQRIRAVTPAESARLLGLRLSPDDLKKVETLGETINAHLIQLRPADAQKVRPYYYPAAPSQDLQQRLLRPPSTFDPHELDRVRAPMSATADAAVRNLHQRLAIPEFAATEEVRTKAFRQFIQDTTSQFEPVLRQGLSDRLAAASIKIDESTSNALISRAMAVWKDAVLIGRLPAWTSINNLGNITNSTMYLIDQWSRGRFVNPVTFAKGLFKWEGTPYYVLESGFSREAARAGRTIPGLSRLRQGLYNLNSITEMGFRNAIYKTEVQQVLKELARDGVQAADITDIAARVGWEKVNEYLYNYTDRWMATTGILRDVTPFLQYNIENVRFWMREVTRNPWLIPQMLRLAEERPEWKAQVPQWLGFLREIGIDERVIDLTSKTNFFDFISKFVESEPQWVKDNKARLGLRLATIESQYKDDPRGLEAVLKADPDLAAYKRYVEQGIAARFLVYAERAAGAGPLVQWVMEHYGVAQDIRSPERRKRQQGVVPQQTLVLDALANFGRRFGIQGLEKLLVEPTDQEIKSELRRLQISEAQQGRTLDLQNAKADSYQQWWDKARMNVIDRRFADRAADFFLPLGAGQFGLQYQKEVWDIMSRDANVRSAIVQGRFAPDPVDVRKFERGRYQLPLEDAIYFARRDYIRRISRESAETRRERSARFDQLPLELRQLIETSDPATRELLKDIDAGFRQLDSMDTEQRREFWDSGDLRARRMRALLDTRYNEDERAVIDEVERLSLRDQERWYRGTRLKDPEKAKIYEAIYPDRVDTFRATDVGGEPATRIVPSPTGIGAPPGSVPILGATRGDDRPPSWDPAAKMPAEAPTPLVPATGGGASAVSAEGLQFIRNREGLRTTAYRDPGDEKEWRTINRARAAQGLSELPYTGRWAIGYGHTGPDVREGTTITPEQAERLFRQDVSRFERTVSESVTRPLNQNQFDALTSLAYNIGPQAFKDSTLVRALNMGNYEVAAQQFGKWNKTTIDGRRVADPGLTQRRTAEADMFQSTTRETTAAGVPTIPVDAQGRPDMRAVPVDRRDLYREVRAATGKVIYQGNIAEALTEYALRVNPGLDPKVANNIVSTIMLAYKDPSTDEAKWYSFDPALVVGIIAARSRFDPTFAQGRRFGLTGLTPEQAPTLTQEDLLDPQKNVRAFIDWFTNAQLRLGTKGALETLGLDFNVTYRASQQVLGLRPVLYGPQTAGRPRAVLEGPDTPAEQSAARFFNNLFLAGGDPGAPGFVGRRTREWADLASKATPAQLEALKTNIPDLFFHVDLARRGRAVWWQGTPVIEDSTDPEYLAWKHKVLSADSVESAAAAYAQGPERVREHFANRFGDMDRFFRDRAAGVQRNYDKWEFSGSQDQAYLDARQKLARAMGQGPSAVKQAMREIRSIYGDDVPGFTRKLKIDSPAMFESLKPYLEPDRPLSPEERHQMRAVQTAIEQRLEEAKTNPERLRDAAAIWRDPSLSGVMQNLFDHEVAWFQRTARLLDDQPPTGSLVSTSEYLPFRRFMGAMSDAREARDPEAMRRIWQSVPEHFRQEYKLNHTDRFVNDEAVINGEDPPAWVESQQRRLYAPYLDYLQMDDVYGAYNPEKFRLIMEENPAAGAYLMRNAEVLGRVRASVHSRLGSMYTGVLRQYNYSPALLNAIPDDGTRYLVTLMDPNAKAAYETNRITVTPRQFPRVKSWEELYGKGSKVEPVLDDAGQPTGTWRVTRSLGDEITGRLTDNTESFTVSAEQLARQMNALTQLPEESPQFKQIKDQFRVHQGISNALQLVYRGVQISQQGGGFFEQLPSYFQAAQAAAQSQLFTGPLAAFLTGPQGLLAGTFLGIIGSIFGANRQRQEEERRERERREQERLQSFAVAERLRSLDQRQLFEIERETGAFGRFLEKPSAITRAGLIEALKVPRPTW